VRELGGLYVETESRSDQGGERDTIDETPSRPVSHRKRVSRSGLDRRGAKAALTMKRKNRPRVVGKTAKSKQVGLPKTKMRIEAATAIHPDAVKITILISGADARWRDFAATTIKEHLEDFGPDAAEQRAEQMLQAVAVGPQRRDASGGRSDEE
jgi:hypothetical protein